MKREAMGNPDIWHKHSVNSAAVNTEYDVQPYVQPCAPTRVV